jgi:hypothetical protein
MGRGLGRGFRRAHRSAMRFVAPQDHVPVERGPRAGFPLSVTSRLPEVAVVEGFAIRIRTETPGSVGEREPTVTRFLARWTTRSAAASPTTRAVRPRRDRASLRVGPELSLRRGVQKRPCAGADSRSSSWPASVHGRSGWDACRHARFQRRNDSLGGGSRGYPAFWHGGTRASADEAAPATSAVSRVPRRLGGAADARGVSRRTPSGRAD